MLHVNRNKVGRSVAQKIIFSMTRVNKVIYQATSLSLWSGLSHFNKIMKSMLRHSYLSRFITSWLFLIVYMIVKLYLSNRLILHQR